MTLDVVPHTPKARTPACAMPRPPSAPIFHRVQQSFCYWLPLAFSFSRPQMLIPDILHRVITSSYTLGGTKSAASEGKKGLVTTSRAAGVEYMSGNVSQGAEVLGLYLPSLCVSKYLTIMKLYSWRYSCRNKKNVQKQNRKIKIVQQIFSQVRFIVHRLSFTFHACLTYYRGEWSGIHQTYNNMRLIWFVGVD